MVSWGDDEESSQDLSSVGTDSIATMYDYDYCGLADGDSPPQCKHNAIAVKFVAFERWNIGRKFLGCQGREGGSCDFVHWVDAEWPSSLQKAVGKLWEMYGEVKEGRIRDALDSLDQKFNYRDEIEKLHRDLRIVQDEFTKAVEHNQATLALKAKAEQALIDVRIELDQKKALDAAATNIHEVLRIKAEKDRDKYKEENTRLEIMVADLLKQKEVHKANIRKIHEICDE